MTPEGRVKAKINKVLEKHGAYKFMPVQTGYGTKTLDYLICAGGYFIAIEAKRPGKEPTKKQELTAREIRAAGGVVFMIDGDPKQLDLLDKFLATIMPPTRVQIANDTSNRQP